MPVTLTPGPRERLGRWCQPRRRCGHPCRARFIGCDPATGDRKPFPIVIVPAVARRASDGLADQLSRDAVVRLGDPGSCGHVASMTYKAGTGQATPPLPHILSRFRFGSGTRRRTEWLIASPVVAVRATPRVGERLVPRLVGRRYMCWTVPDAQRADAAMRGVPGAAMRVAGAMACP